MLTISLALFRSFVSCRVADEAALAATRGAEKDKKGKIKLDSKDEDPRGAKLAGVADPIKVGQKYIELLGEFRGDDERSHLLAFDAAVRRKKPLLAIRALLRARRVTCGGEGEALPAPSPQLFERMALFFHSLTAAEPNADAAAGEYVGGEMPTAEARAGGDWACAPFVPNNGVLHPAVASTVQAGQDDAMLLGGASAQAFIDAYVAAARAGTSVLQKVAAARVLVATRGPAAAVEALALLPTEVGGDGGANKGLSMKEAKAVLTCLRGAMVSSAPHTTPFEQACLARFPMCTAFGGGFVFPVDPEAKEGEDEDEE